MKTLFLLLFILYSPLKHEQKALKIVNNNHDYIDYYEKTIEFIKQHEGFRDTIYDDNGYQCIGYGQRLKCFKGNIPVPLSEKQADSILRISFNEHLSLVNVIFPKMTKNKRLAIGHLSYCKGISLILRNDLLKDGYLDTLKLLRLKNKENRVFEKNLFYNIN